MPHLSIIIPCYNESRRIPATMPRLAAYLETLTVRERAHVAQAAEPARPTPAPPITHEIKPPAPTSQPSARPPPAPPITHEIKPPAPTSQPSARPPPAPPFTHEVLLLVERCPDNTLAIAQQIAAAHPNWRAIDNKVHRGKGYAVRSGMTLAQGEYMCYMDADLSTEPTAIHEALAILERDPAIAIMAGDRRHPASAVTRNPGKSRPLFSHIFNLIARLLFPRSIKTGDTQCGFKMFRASAAREIFSRARLDGFAFDVEIFHLARRHGFKVQMIPVHWTDAPYSTVRALRHSAQMFRDLLRLRLFSK